MDHEVHIVEQYPAPLRQSFHMMGLDPRRRECRNEMLRHSPYMRVRRSRNDHEVIGGAAQTTQVQYHGIDRFAVQQRLNDL